jgi:cytoskeleton protein RodZ
MEAGTQPTAPGESGWQGEKTERMETITTILRQAREHKGVSLKDVEGKTRIPLKYLQALEGEAERGLLADEMYLIPFLRSYANFLGVDANLAVTRFLTELQRQDAATVAPPEHRPPVVRPSSGPSRLAAWIGPFLLLLVALVFGSYLWQQGHWQALVSWWQSRPAREEIVAESSISASPSAPAPAIVSESPVAVVPPPSSVADPNTASPVPAPTSVPGQESSTAVATVPTPSSAAAVAVVPQPGSSAMVAPTAQAPVNQGMPVSSAAVPATTAAVVPQPESPAVVAASPTTLVVPPGGHRLSVQANAPTWMRVVVDNQPGKEMLLKPGESREWVAESGFTLSLGNAGGVTLNLDGQELPPAGKSGQVVKNMRLPASTAGQ